MSKFTLSLFLACGYMASATQAATTDDPAITVTPVLAEGDIIPGLGTVTNIYNVRVNDSGDWIANVFAAAPGNQGKSAVLKNGALLVVKGDSIPSIPGATYLATYTIDLDNEGDVSSVFQLSGTSGVFDDYVVWTDGNVLAREGDPLVAPGVSPGTTWKQLDRVRVNDSQVFVTAEVDDPQVPGEFNDALVRFDLTPSGSVAATSIIAAQGMPGAGTGDLIGTLSDIEFEVNPSGDVLYVAYLGSSNETKPTLILNNSVIGRANNPSVVPGQNWSAATLPSFVDLNASGLVSYRWLLGSGQAQQDVLVRGDHAYVIEGDILPETVPFGIGKVAAAKLNDRGDLLWRGDWDLLSGDSFFREEAFFLNKKQIVRKDETTIGGKTLLELAGIECSDNGRYVIYGANTLGDQDLLVRLDFGPWEELSGEKSGSTPAPQLVGIGSLQPGAPTTLRIDDGPSNGLVTLVVGSSLANLPFLGTTLVPSPDVVIPVSLDGEGSFELRTPWPNGLPSATSIYLQAFIADPSATLGFAATNAVRGTTP